MNTPIFRLLTSWLVCSLGLWIAASFLSTSISFETPVSIVFAGLILACVNLIIKPILIIFTLPAIVLTLGLFMILINGFTVYLVSLLYAPLDVTNYWAAVFAGMVIGLVNYLVTTILDIEGKKS